MTLDPRELYPEIEPREAGKLQVDDTHSLAWWRLGNPKGVPVVFLHGGPGGTTRPFYRRFYDPAYYDICMFDQRGAGQSTPASPLGFHFAKLWYFERLYPMVFTVGALARARRSAHFGG